MKKREKTQPTCISEGPLCISIIRPEKSPLLNAGLSRNANKKEMALYLAKKGFSNFQVGEDKKPFDEWKPFQTRVPTIEEIYASWQERPDANIALVTGKINNLTIVDCDSPMTKEIVESYLPDSYLVPTVATPHGGHHYYFQHCPELPCTSKKDALIHIRSEGGYAVCPPSRISDGSYSWVSGFNADSISSAPPIPEKLLDYLKTLTPGAKLNLIEVLKARYGMKFTPSGHALCPFHYDTHPSLHVKKNKKGYWSWRCYGCGKHGSLADFEQLMDKGSLVSIGSPRMGSWRILKIYDYTDASGKLVFQCVRIHPKDFRFRRPDGNGGWIWNLNDVELVPYRLPDINRAELIVIVEGEKDADNIKENLNLTATTNPMGAGKWNNTYNRHFQGKNIIVVPDNDVPGRSHARDIANSLVGIAQEIRVVELPDLPEKGDISDWLARGGNLQSFNQLAENSPLFEPEETELAQEQTEHPGTLRIFTLRDFLSREVQGRDMLINPLLAKKELGILSGPAKLGKSLYIMNISISLAAGIGFNNFEIPRASRVLYIQQEIGESALYERYRKMLSRGEIPEQEGWADRISINSSRGILIDTDVGYDSVRRAIDESRPDILIPDPLITFHTKNENSAEEMAGVFRIFHKLIDEYGIAILMVHHFGKPTQVEREGGELHRGSSVIASSSDSNWTFKRIPSNKYRTERPRNEYAELSFELRNAESPNPIILHRNPETLWYEIATLQENRRVTPEMIRDIVQEQGGRVLQDAVITTLRPLVSERLIKEAIYEAENKGYIGSRRTRGRGSPKELFPLDLKR